MTPRCCNQNTEYKGQFFILKALMRVWYCKVCQRNQIKTGGVVMKTTIVTVKIQEGQTTLSDKSFKKSIERGDLKVLSINRTQHTQKEKDNVQEN